MDPAKLSITQIAAYGITAIAIIASLAFSIRSVVGKRSVRFKTPAGEAEIGDFTGSVAATVAETYRLVSDLVKTSTIQNRRITGQHDALRELIRSQRSVCFGLKKMGGNGDITKALERVDAAEDAINDGVDKAADAATAIQTKAATA